MITKTASQRFIENPEPEASHYKWNHIGIYGHFAIHCCDIGCKIIPPNSKVNQEYEEYESPRFNKLDYTFILNTAFLLHSLNGHRESNGNFPAIIKCKGCEKRFELTLEKVEAIHKYLLGKDVHEEMMKRDEERLMAEAERMEVPLPNGR